MFQSEFFPVAEHVSLNLTWSQNPRHSFEWHHQDGNRAQTVVTDVFRFNLNPFIFGKLETRFLELTVLLNHVTHPLCLVPLCWEILIMLFVPNECLCQLYNNHIS